MRVGGAEVVEREANAVGAKNRRRSFHAPQLGQGCLFSDLQDQTGRRDSGISRCVDDPIAESVDFREHQRMSVDGDETDADQLSS